MGKAQTEQLCIQSWFCQWTNSQKAKFLDVIVKEVLEASEEDLLVGFGNISLAAGSGPDVFDCQLKLFTGWWRGWSQDQRRSLLQQQANIDPEFGEHAAARIGLAPVN